MNVRWKVLMGVWVCVMLVTGLLPPVRPNHVAYSAPAAPEESALPQSEPVAGPPLRLTAGTFDPLRDAGPGRASAALQFSAYPGDGAGYYLVQFQGPIAESDVESLEAAGAEVFDYIPDFAFIIKMDSATRATVERQAQVRWVGVYQPAYRMTPDLLARAARVNETATREPAGADGKKAGGVIPEEDVPISLVVSIFRGEPVAPVAALVQKMGGEILDQSQTEWQSKLKVTLPAAALVDVATLSGVRWIEPAPQWRLHNDKSDNIMGVRPLWTTQGLYGAGQVVAVCDTGLDQGSTAPASLHDDFEDGSGNSRVLAIYDRAGDGASDVNSGHGTHVAGSVLGNGARSGANPASHTYPESAYVGMAPEARLIMQAVEHNATGYLTGIPMDLNDLFIQAKTGGAHLHTNSWGSDVSGQYTTDSEAVDQFMWSNKDFTIFFSAGNAGIDNNADGVVDLYSLGSPATAKNCVTVGASENDRPAISSTWGGGRPADFPANPVRDDRVADNIAGLAAFSGRGPVLDGRYKPDVVAPGTFIASVRSSQASETGWGGIDAYYMYMGGTSMSTPLTAGAATLIRQYYTDRESHTPSAALIKATLVNGATDIYPGQYGGGATREIPTTRPTNVAGWGRVNIANSIFPAAPRVMRYQDQTSGLGTGGSNSYNYQVTSSAEPFRVTLAWTDYPGSPVAAGGLVNDLDLTITGPGGATYYPNNANQRGKSQYLAYDSGFESDGYTWSAGRQVAVRFTPTQYPATLQTGVFLLAANNPTNYPQTFTWYVYSGNNTSGPTSVLATGSSTIRSAGWHVIDFSSANVTIASGDFFLAIGLPNDKLVWFYDNTAPDSRSWDYNGSSWSKVTTEDYMFNAVVSSAAATTQQDRVNNLVGIDVPSPATGLYTVTVKGYNVPKGPQPYALVVSGIFDTPNTAPTLSGLPNQTLRPGESKNNAIDLWAYASDAQDASSALTFTITNSPPPTVGVSIRSNRYIDINPTGSFTGAFPVVVEVMDTGGLTDTDSFTITFIEAQYAYIYLPLVVRRYPPIPYPPTLNAIANSDGDGAYAVSWSAADLASTYELQEATNSAFSGATIVYSGASTSWNASGKGGGTYYYRVRGENSYGYGAWSNVQSVRVSPPTQLYATDDADISQAYPDTNDGASTSMLAGYDDYFDPDWKIMRSLIKFNLSAIPANTSISNAVLRVRYKWWWDYPGQSRTITSYRIGSNWSEGNVTWNTAPAIGEAYGSVALVASDSALGWYSIDVTNLVRGWVNGTWPNYGIMLRGPEHSGSDSSWRGFGTKEAGDAPELQITYTGMATTVIELDHVVPAIVYIPSNGIRIPRRLGNVSQDTPCDLFGCITP